MGNIVRDAGKSILIATRRGHDLVEQVEQVTQASKDVTDIANLSLTCADDLDFSAKKKFLLNRLTLLRP